MSELVVTLRHNISVESDVDLAQAELAALTDRKLEGMTRVESGAALRSRLQHAECDDRVVSFLSRSLRENGACALVIPEVTLENFHRVIMGASFIQEAALLGEDQELPPSPFYRSKRAQGHSVHMGIPVGAILEYSAYLLRKRDSLGSMGKALDSLLAYLLDGIRPPRKLGTHIQTACRAKKTTLYLTHELHLYKGKSFPRLVRSLINRYATSDTEAVVCDPFVGSGTVLLEAALLGHPSIGLDVDPTSVLISENKTDLASIPLQMLLEVCDKIATTDFPDPRVGRSSSQKNIIDDGFDISNWRKFLASVPEPMSSRLKKRGEEMGEDLLGEIECDSAIINCMIAQMPERVRSVFRVCLSHALTKKIRLRFVGIGNQRFTFDVAKARVLDIFNMKTHHVLAIAETFQWLKDRGLTLGSARTLRASAMNLLSVVGPESIDLIVTSPPYIPASSGREHYARARAISLVLTGACAEQQLAEIDKDFVGEIRIDTPEVYDDLPDSVRRTLDFLRSDPERKRKFPATLQYYRDIEQVLENTYHALKPSGTALFIVARSHTFYVHKTKRIVHKVDAAKAFCDLAAHAGFDVVRVIDVPLQKSGGLNARPRSTDEYAEAVIELRRP